MSGGKIIKFVLFLFLDIDDFDLFVSIAGTEQRKFTAFHVTALWRFNRE